MGHGSEVYFPRGMRELGNLGAVWGLDKIWEIAPEMVRSCRFSRTSRRCCAAISASSLWNDCCASWWRPTRMSRLW